MKKQSSSQVAWALITAGVSSSRLEVHRIQHYVSQVQALVEQSEAKEHLYQVAGDSLTEIPKALKELERKLDKTSYALSIMGKEFLRGRLTIQDRDVVHKSVEPAQLGGRDIVSNVLEKFWLRKCLEK